MFCSPFKPAILIAIIIAIILSSHFHLFNFQNLLIEFIWLNHQPFIKHTPQSAHYQDAQFQGNIALQCHDKQQ